MSTIFDNDVLIHHVASPGLPGDGFTAPEAAAIRADIDDVMARPIIDNLDDLVPGATSGQVPIKQSGGSWLPGPAGRPIQALINGTPIPGGENIRYINIPYGLAATVSDLFPGEPMLTILPNYGGTGASTTLAHSDHTHEIFTDWEFPFSATGTLSGGTRPLVSSTITGLDPAKTYVVKGKLYLHMRGDGTGASFARPRLTINSAAKDIFEDSRVVAGVLVTETVPHAGVTVTGVTSVPVTATVAFQPGDPAYIGGGVVVIEIEANR